MVPMVMTAIALTCNGEAGTISPWFKVVAGHLLGESRDIAVLAFRLGIG